MNSNFSQGKKVSVTAIKKTSFGLFCRIPGTDIPGLIERDGLNSTDEEPKIGSEFEAVILQFIDSNRPVTRQFRLSIHPALLNKTDLIEPGIE